jgi:hypothetical protein
VRVHLNLPLNLPQCLRTSNKSATGSRQEAELMVKSDYQGCLSRFC